MKLKFVLFTDSESKKRSRLERTRIPPHKDNAEESQRFSSQPSKPDKAPVKSIDKIVKAGDGDVRYMPVVFHCQRHHQMLRVMLDETTLFFWNLGNEARAERAGITAQTLVANWVNVTVPGLPSPPVSQSSTSTRTLSSRVLSQPRSVRTMSTQSSQSQSPRSALSAQVSVRGYARAARNNEDEGSFVGGIFDHDELEGDEFKDSQNSPVKGKRHVNSRVCLYVFMVTLTNCTFTPAYRISSGSSQAMI